MALLTCRPQIPLGEQYVMIVQTHPSATAGGGPWLVFLTFADYRETAAKFQKEWHVQQPHRQFDFANHVKSHALVSVINKGLCYQALEREHATKVTQFASDRRVAGTRLFVFSPRRRG